MNFCYFGLFWKFYLKVHERFEWNFWSFFEVWIAFKLIEGFKSYLAFFGIFNNFSEFCPIFTIFIWFLIPILIKISQIHKKFFILHTFPQFNHFLSTHHFQFQLNLPTITKSLFSSSNVNHTHVFHTDMIIKIKTSNPMPTHMHKDMKLSPVLLNRRIIQNNKFNSK
jgi:hypothetical protein